MTTAQTNSVLERAIRATGEPMAPAAAREFLRWQLSVEDDRRMDELSAKNRAGTLSQKERDELEELCTTIDLLSLLHLYAREAIGDLPKPGA